MQISSVFPPHYNFIEEFLIRIYARKIQLAVVITKIVILLPLLAQVKPFKKQVYNYRHRTVKKSVNTPNIP